MTELAERMAAFGVRMAFHHHMGTIIETDAEIDRLMASTGEAAGLLFDSGHCLFAGGDPAAAGAAHRASGACALQGCAARVCWTRALAEDMRFMGAVLAGVFTVPGDGCIDFTPLLRHAAEAGYAGWLVVEAEQDPRMAHPLTYAKLGYRNLRAMAAEAGWN